MKADFYYYRLTTRKWENRKSFVCCTIYNIMITTALDSKKTKVKYNDINLPEDVEHITYQQYEDYLREYKCLKYDKLNFNITFPIESKSNKWTNKS